MLRLLTCLSLTSLLAGCLGVPLGSLYRLSQIDPLQADPAALRVAIRHPGVLAVHHGHVELRMAYSAETGELELDERLPVQVLLAAQPTAALQDGRRAGEEVTILHLAEPDAARMRAFQQAVRTHRAQGFEGKGSFGISVTGACRTAALPDGPLEVDIFFNTSREEDFFAVQQDLDLRGVEDDEGNLVARIGAC